MMMMMMTRVTSNRVAPLDLVVTMDFFLLHDGKLEPARRPLVRFRMNGRRLFGIMMELTQMVMTMMITLTTMKIIDDNRSACGLIPGFDFSGVNCSHIASRRHHIKLPCPFKLLVKRYPQAALQHMHGWQLRWW
jgi:hypothetical protein